MLELKHDLKLAKNRDEKARMNFVSGLRSYVLNDMANGMRAVYDAEIEPDFRRTRKRAPKDGPEVHARDQAERLLQVLFQPARDRAGHGLAVGVPAARSPARRAEVEGRVPEARQSSARWRSSPASKCRAPSRRSTCT